MAYYCQFCGDLDELDIALRCRACGAENVVKNESGSHCESCGLDNTEVDKVCATCGSTGLEQ